MKKNKSRKMSFRERLVLWRSSHPIAAKRCNLAAKILSVILAILACISFVFVIYIFAVSCSSDTDFSLHESIICSHNALPSDYIPPLGYNSPVSFPVDSVVPKLVTSASFSFPSGFSAYYTRSTSVSTLNIVASSASSLSFYYCFDSADSDPLCFPISVTSFTVGNAIMLPVPYQDYYYDSLSVSTYFPFLLVYNSSSSSFTSFSTASTLSTHTYIYSDFLAYYMGSLVDGGSPGDSYQDGFQDGYSQGYDDGLQAGSSPSSDLAIFNYFNSFPSVSSYFSPSGDYLRVLFSAPNFTVLPVTNSSSGQYRIGLTEGFGFEEMPFNLSVIEDWSVLTSPLSLNSSTSSYQNVTVFLEGVRSFSVPRVLSPFKDSFYDDSQYFNSLHFDVLFYRYDSSSSVFVNVGTQHFDSFSQLRLLSYDLIGDYCFINPVYESNLNLTDSETAFNIGYNSGYNSGYSTGFENGSSSGYDTGFSAGFNAAGGGIGYSWLINFIDTFLNYNFFGTISIGMLLGIIIFGMIALIFLRIFAGG